MIGLPSDKNNFIPLFKNWYWEKKSPFVDLYQIQDQPKVSASHDSISSFQPNPSKNLLILKKSRSHLQIQKNIPPRPIWNFKYAVIIELDGLLMATGEIPSVDLEKRAPMRFVLNVSWSVPHRGAVSMACLESVFILHLGRGLETRAL